MCTCCVCVRACVHVCVCVCDSQVVSHQLGNQKVTGLISPYETLVLSKKHCSSLTSC